MTDTSSTTGDSQSLDTRPTPSRTQSQSIRPTPTEYAAFSALLDDEPPHPTNSSLARKLLHKGPAPLNTNRTESPTDSPSGNTGTGIGTGIGTKKRDFLWPRSATSKPDTLEHIILHSAKTLILQKGLFAPHNDNSDEILEEPTLPIDLVSSTKDLVNRLLSNIAASRPVTTKKQKRDLPPVRWEGILETAASISRNDGDMQVVKKTMERLEGLYPSEEPNRTALKDRLATLAKYAPEPPDEELYAPVRPKQAPKIKKVLYDQKRLRKRPKRYHR